MERFTVKTELSVSDETVSTTSRDWVYLRSLLTGDPGVPSLPGGPCGPGGPGGPGGPWNYIF